MFKALLRFNKISVIPIEVDFEEKQKEIDEIEIPLQFMTNKTKRTF